jgi:hypothetical protein
MAGETQGDAWDDELISKESDAVRYFESTGVAWIDVKSRSWTGRKRNIDAIGWHEQQDFQVTYPGGRRTVRKIVRGVLGIKFHGNRVYLYPVSRVYYDALVEASFPGKWFRENMQFTTIRWYRA